MAAHATKQAILGSSWVGASRLFFATVAAGETVLSSEEHKQISDIPYALLFSFLLFFLFAPFMFLLMA